MPEIIRDEELLERVVWDDADGYHVVHTEDHGSTRWQRIMETVFVRESDGKIFACHWYQGSTENCDHSYPDEAYEAKENIRTITVTEYVRVK